MVPLDGSTQYLKEKKKSERTVRNALVYHVKTKDEALNIYHKDVRNSFANYDIQSGVATHVVVGITWGARSVLACSYKNTDKEADIDKKLSTFLKDLSQSIQGKPSIDRKTDGYEFLANFQFHIYGDILPDKVNLPTHEAEALNLMKQLPTLVASSNDGKGRPLTFTMIPLTILEDYLNLDKKLSVEVINMKEVNLIRIVKMFEEVTKVQQKLHDFLDDVMIYKFCVKHDDVAKVLGLKHKVAMEEISLRSKVADALTKSRAGQCD